MYFHVNRTVCDVLEEMRKCYEVRNFSYVPSLIEELQVMGNRMEAKLHDYAAIRDAHAEIKRLKKEIKQLKEEKDGI